MLSIDQDVDQSTIPTGLQPLDYEPKAPVKSGGVSIVKLAALASLAALMLFLVRHH